MWLGGRWGQRVSHAGLPPLGKVATGPGSWGWLDPVHLLVQLGCSRVV